MDLDLPDIPYSFLGLPQYETERILAEHLARFGVSAERNVELQSFQQTEAKVVATLNKLGGVTEIIECQYLVGCDGAHSGIRRSLNLSFEGDRYPTDYMLGDVAVAWSLPHGLSYRFSNTTNGKANYLLICVPLPETGRYRLSMNALEQPQQVSEEEAHGILGDRPSPTLAELPAVVDRTTPAGTKIHDPRWSSRYRISHRIVSEYSVGRVFIAGGAAHIHPPIGGQGMNTGLQDAYNLAWKLALKLHGVSAPGLLDSYNAERLPVGQEVVGRSHKRMTAKPEASVGNRELMQDSQLLVNYRDSQWVGQVTTSDVLVQEPQPGDRAPDVYHLQRQGLGFPVRIFDLLRGTAHKLLIYADTSFTEKDYRQMTAISQTLRQRYGKFVEVYGIIDSAVNPMATLAIGPTLFRVIPFKRT